ncbi:unnamed protein product [Phytophthora fragariaefolia]|uniref:Unnamed protein product n=1 Tax=Phytophthora fragariaefolia TaxID=1490495 RepID=A0A9W7CZ67_9STRA|nr:unnamed protein product [Phytophthora fragariaefolia]
MPIPVRESPTAERSSGELLRHAGENGKIAWVSACGSYLRRGVGGQAGNAESEEGQDDDDKDWLDRAGEMALLSDTKRQAMLPVKMLPKATRAELPGRKEGKFRAQRGEKSLRSGF